MKNIIAKAVLAAAVFCVAATAVAADTPEQVERQYFEALRTRGMTAVPEFIHPDELGRFRDMLGPVLAADTPVASNLRSAVFGPDTTAETLQALSPEAFMRGFMAFAQGTMQTMQLTVGESHVLGSVNEGEVVHLVTRNTAAAGALQLTQLEVISLKPYQGSWRLLLSGKLEGMAQALKAQAAAQ